jgi:N-hydroxyarylamine O-acetyltransferase
MRDDTFNVDAWLHRIGHRGPRDPGLPALRALIAAHTATIPFENIDVLLGRPPRLDLESLQRKMITARRGGYCFELNSLLQAGLTALGFQVTGLIARVIRGMEADAHGAAAHMMLRVDLPEGPFLADAGFGNGTPTAPLALRPGVEQQTPHETMRLWSVGDELALQAKLADEWMNIYRISPHPRLSIDYEVANWFTATYPTGVFVNNLIVARPGPERTRNTLFNGQVTIRRPGDRTTRSRLESEDDYQTALDKTFGLILAKADLTAALEALDRKDTRDAPHPFFS